MTLQYPDNTISVTFTSPESGGLPRTIQSKSSDITSVIDFGNVGDGIIDALPAFQSLENSTNRLHIVPSGTYNLYQTWTPSAADTKIVMAGDVTFNSNLPDFSNLFPNQIGPIQSTDLTYKEYGSDWDGSGNVFQVGSAAISNITTVPIVAIHGTAIGRVSGSKTWGGNFVSYADASGATAIATEINCGVLTSGGTAYGVVVASAGTAGQPENALQIQANTSSSKFKSGVVFNFSSNPAISGELIKATGSGTATHFIKSSGITYSGAEIDLPSFAVGATPSTGSLNRILVSGAVSGGSPTIEATGPDTDITLNIKAKGSTGKVALYANGYETLRIAKPSGTYDTWVKVKAGNGGAIVGVQSSLSNSDLVINGKGTGGVRIQDGSGTNKIQVNTSGIGFFGATPTTSPTWDTPTGGDYRATWDSGTVSLSTLSRVVKSMEVDLINYGILRT